MLFEPGTSSAYSNSDFVLLGLIVERVTGRPLDQVVASRIIRRLHLRGTSYGTVHAQRMTPWLGLVESFGRPVSGDGGIISTVEDVATFFRVLLGGNLLAPKQLAEMTSTIATDRPDLRYGLGIWRYRLPRGFAWGHGGLASYALDVEAARDGSKAVVWQRTTPRWPTGALATTLTAPYPRRHAPMAPRRGLLCQWRLALEGYVDGAGEGSFEAADCLAAAFAFDLFAFEVVAGGRVDARLGDCDPVERAVELAVAATVEAVGAAS